MANLSSEEKQRRLEDIIRGALRQAVEEQVVDEHGEVAMVVDWVLLADTMDTDGEPGTAFIHPFDQRTPEALKLITIGKLSCEEGIRDWLRGED